MTGPFRVVVAAGDQLNCGFCKRSTKDAVEGDLHRRFLDFYMYEKGEGRGGFS